MRNSAIELNGMKEFIRVDRFVVMLAIPLLVLSCSTTGKLQLTAMEPAPVDLQNSIKRIGIVNTSPPAAKAEFENRLEQLISYEDYRLVKQGKKAALDALYNELKGDRRFDTVLLLPDTPDALLGLNSAPSSQEWDHIAELCREKGIDAIFSLTSFETDTRVTSKKAKVEGRDILRVKNTARGHEVTLETLMENGWRIYSPQGAKVIDEFIYTNQIVATAKGITPVRALESLETREENIISQSELTGSTYGLRLKPYEKAFEREYYRTGTENFKLAHEAIQSGAIDRAKIFLEKELISPKVKTTAKAYYNLAVLAEYENRLEEALNLARQAREADEGILIGPYLQQLETRLESARTVAMQLAFSTAADSP